MVDKKVHNSGFALLVSLIVIGVVLSVGLVILDLTIKQVRLAATTKDSEIAFHAANAGMECARFWRRSESGPIASGANMTGVTCYGQSSSPDPVVPTSVPLTCGAGCTGEIASQYEYEFTWGPSNDRCTRINMIAAAAPVFGTDAVIEIATIQGRIAGYPGTTDVTCTAGSQCTIVAVKGYNQACPVAGSNFGYGVVERQVLLEF